MPLSRAVLTAQWLGIADAIKQSRLTDARLLEAFIELALVALTAQGGSEQLWEAALAWCDWLAAEAGTGGFCDWLAAGGWNTRPLSKL